MGLQHCGVCSGKSVDLETESCCGTVEANRKDERSVWCALGMLVPILSEFPIPLAVAELQPLVSCGTSLVYELQRRVLHFLMSTIFDVDA